MDTIYAPVGWPESHHCHPAVANAIHTIATRNRSPEAIWKDPTEAEWQRAIELVDAAVDAGLHRHEDDDAYAWDKETWLQLP